IHIHSPHSTLLIFFSYRSGSHRDLHSFPTRRSSDLGYIDHAAFLGTINPDTNKIPKHLFQGYLNIYNNYFKAPWMPDRTEASTADRKSGSAGMPRPISYAVFCLKKKKHAAYIKHI